MTVLEYGQEFFTRERCYIAELLNNPDDSRCSIARARVAPGVTTERHALRGVTERYIILSGSGRVTIGDETIDVGPTTVVHIPPEVPQHITNTGDADLVFLCVCVPRFTPECYQSLDNGA